MDIAFREDTSQICKDNSGENLALVWHTVLNLLSAEMRTTPCPVNKRLKAAWDNSY